MFMTKHPCTLYIYIYVCVCVCVHVNILRSVKNRDGFRKRHFQMYFGMNIIEFQLKFHESLSIRDQLTIIQY